MATIDEMGRRAGRAALEEAGRSVDVDESFERITSRTGALSLSIWSSDGDRGERRSMRRWMALAAAATIVVVVAGILVVTGGSGRPRVVTDDPPVGPTTPEPAVDPVRLASSLADVVTLDVDEPTFMQAAVSPNGEWVAYEGREQSVCLASLTGTETSWCENIPEFGFGQLTWAPDSSRFTGDYKVQLGRPTRPSVVAVDGSWATLDLDVDRPLVGATFALDGESIVGAFPGATDTDPARFVIVDADTGATRDLAEYPGQLGSYGSNPFPIDTSRSVFFVGQTPDDPNPGQTLYIVDHTDGTLQQIPAPDDKTLPRYPIAVTSTGPTVVLVSRARPLEETTDGGTRIAFLDVELWDIDTGDVTPLPSTPPGITPFGSTISPDGEHLAMAWSTEDGTLELGVARIDDLDAADGVWDSDAWSVETLNDGDPDVNYSVLGRRSVCWCGDRLAVIALNRVYTLDLIANS